MTAAALHRLREQLVAALATVEEHIAALEGEAPAHAEREVELGAAMAITKLSSSTLYRIAPRFGLGFQLPSGQWRFYEKRLRAYVAPRGEIGERDGEIGEGCPVHTNANHPHISGTDAGTTT